LTHPREFSQAPIGENSGVKTLGHSQKQADILAGNEAVSYAADEARRSDWAAWLTLAHISRRLENSAVFTP